MDGRAFFREVMDEAGRLGLGFWERLALILATALLIVTGRETWDAVKRIEWKVELAPEVDEGGVVIDMKTRTGDAPRDPSDGNG